MSVNKIVMINKIEQKLLTEIEELKLKVTLLNNNEQTIKPIFQYSKIRDKELDSVVDIEKKIRTDEFNSWFKNDITISDDLTEFFQTIIDDSIDLVNDYNEEDLKVNIIIPILNKVRFKSFEDEFRDFYELPMRYETDSFIFNGTTDFVVSKGLVKSKKPYFFIQEFKKSEEYGNPRPQLLAELISGVEINGWNEIKGAFVIGAIWNFVILKKLEKERYEYFISKGFDSMRIEDIKSIFKNLLVIKQEIVNKIAEEKNFKAV
ncbi:MAG: hypothetical protein U9P38_06725 [Campylobacterota bacterium]|nr:hypothetical protein [Campylobacterota bacterium]